jgi:POT family proton-dependent oligopeptide transporter
MTVALIVYLYAMPTLPPDEMHKAKAAGLDKRPLDRSEWRAVLALIVLFLPTTLFWATYEQQGNTIALWADQHTDRSIDFIVWQSEIPVTWFQAFNPFMIFTFTPLIITFWTWQAGRGNANAHGTKPPGENLAIDPVAIADDVAWAPFPPAGFGELPGNPFGAGVCRYAEP